MLAKHLVALGFLSPLAMAQSSSSAVGAGVLPSTQVVPSATSRSASAAASSSSVSATPTYSGPPALVLPSLSTYTACASARLNWQLLNANPASYTVTFGAHNSGVDQAIPSASSSPAVPSVTTTPLALVAASTLRPITLPIAPASSASSSSATRAPVVRDLPLQHAQPVKRTRLSINQTLGTNPASFGYTIPVALPEGRYMLVASVPALGLMASTPFTVLESSDTSCLAAFAALSASLSSSASSKATASSGGAQTSGSAAGSGGAPVGAIAGGIVGGLAVLAIIGGVIFCLMRRKRRSRAAEGGGNVMRESEKAYNGASATTGRSISRPQRIPSEAAISPPSSNSSHGPSSYPFNSAMARNQAIGPSLPQSQRGSISTFDSPFGKSPIDTPRPAESAVLRGEREMEREYNDPFATPLGNPHRRSVPVTAVSPPARPESEVDPGRRASSPVPAFSGSVPFGAYPSAAGPASSNASQTPGRSPSGSEMARRPSVGGGTEAGMMRKGSTKRKPVPSLGPELRRQMDGDKRSPSGESSPAGGSVRKKQQFSLMPDMPTA
ncbi:uncharacterized protein MKK02DRAFT_45072 [Dioszegia hungarica]|uniref:Uncharacterized protein n=1 Tax=Dioszegia hungarica TaxID=4972 RepID=A0AA38HA21_9TREE|nr:uncharacterized protein MKK02DRAFT_45072 [Dioszegia hungarica]KAI9636365.1 hypothetical protein MKK02DRAFT_45072 [Dioszegia hungarica]